MSNKDENQSVSQALELANRAWESLVRNSKIDEMLDGTTDEEWEDRYLDPIMSKSPDARLPYGVSWPEGIRALRHVGGGKYLNSKRWRVTICLSKPRYLGCSDMYRASLMSDCAACFFKKVDLDEIFKTDKSEWGLLVNHAPSVIRRAMESNGEKSRRLLTFFQGLKDSLEMNGVYVFDPVTNRIRKSRVSVVQNRIISFLEKEVVSKIDAIDAALRGVAQSASDNTALLDELKASAAKDRESVSYLFRVLIDKQQAISDRMQELTAAIIAANTKPNNEGNTDNEKDATNS